MQAMILAAGFGTRLLPYTRLKPKPLFPVLNTPLLVALVHRLKSCGFDRIIINCHHLADQIIDAVESIPGVILQRESVILGTGGGLREACDKLEDAPLLVTNADIYHTIDFLEFYRAHVEAGNAVTMALHDFPRFNSVSVAGDRVRRFNGSAGESGALAFTGVQVLDPELLAGIEKSSASCIIEYYRSLLTAGRQIHVSRVDGCHWTDMGTPEDYLRLHRDLLLGKIPCWEELSDAADGNNRPFCIAPGAECGEGISMQDWAAVGKARIGEGARISRCVVWDGAEIAPGAQADDRIIGPSTEI